MSLATGERPKSFLSLAKDERPRSYATRECGDFKVGWGHGPILNDYLISHERSVVLESRGSGGRAHSLEEVLKELRAPEFIDRLSRMRSGREDSLFQADLSLAKLIRHLRGGGGTERAAVERLLDELFEDLRKGEEFAHTEVVMAILFALQRAESSLFEEAAVVLSQTRAAELGRLSRYAKRLLGR